LSEVHRQNFTRGLSESYSFAAEGQAADIRTTYSRSQGRHQLLLKVLGLPFGQSAGVNFETGNDEVSCGVDVLGYQGKSNPDGLHRYKIYVVLSMYRRCTPIQPGTKVTVNSPGTLFSWGCGNGSCCKVTLYRLGIVWYWCIPVSVVRAWYSSSTCGRGLLSNFRLAVRAGQTRDHDRDNQYRSGRGILQGVGT
jgi:hypothetical protein